MSLLALIPLAVITAGVVALAIVSRQVMQGVIELQESFRALQRLRPAIVALRQEATQVRRDAMRLRS